MMPSAPSFTDAISASRQQHASADAEKERTQAIISAIASGSQQITGAMHDILIATVIAKDPQIKEVASNLTELLGSIQDAKDKISSTGFDGIGKKFDSLASSIASLSTQLAKPQTNDAVLSALERLNRTLASKNFSPAIEVNPTVNISEVKATLAEIRDLLSKDTPQTDDHNRVNLEDYRAQDMGNEDDVSMQYVGYMNQNGGWYIVANDTDANTLRYKFGKDGYKDAWDNRVGQNYRLLSEAVDEA